MVRIFRQYVPISVLLLAAVEFAILFTAILAGILIRYVGAGGADWENVRFLPEAATFVGVFGLILFAFGLYQREYLHNLRAVFVRLATGAAVAVVVYSLVFYLFPSLLIWRSALLIAVVFATVGIAITRLIAMRFAHFERFKQRVLVVGAGRRAARIERLEADRHASFTAVGYLATGEKEHCVTPARVLSHVPCLAEFARQRQVDQIVVAVDDCRFHLPTEALLACKLDGLNVVQYSTFWERETGTVDLDTLNPSWLIFSDGFADSALKAVLKRFCDITVSMALLVFTLPLLVATAIAIRIEDPGPIFYRQERVGRGGRRFMLLKFRSMRVDAEDDGTPRWATAGDDRVTRVGAFIRKTRIDEIPQVINVLKGDMSCVGPRPERPYFVEKLAREIPYYIERYRAKPGITGWAQIKYPYGASVEDARRKLEYDLYYMKNYNIMLDLLILVQTARVVFWPSSAGPAVTELPADVRPDLDKRPANSRPAA